jgi:polyhydroxyalkanoate synthesis regulator phasin
MGLGDIVQKAVFLGIGVASYAGEKAGEKLGELRSQLQKMADEMVERGEMTTEEARKFVDDMVKQAQQNPPTTPNAPTPLTEPRKIEILDDDTASTSSNPPPNNVEEMRRQVADLQEELRRLKRD